MTTLAGYNWYTEATSGIAWAHCGSCRTTKFAFPITLAQAFNRTLWGLTGRQIGREARALMNEGVEYSTFWAPGAFFREMSLLPSHALKLQSCASSLPRT